MPLAVRTIEPAYLGRRLLREEEEGEEVVQVAVTHNAVLGALAQLASLVRHADDLFCDLADECQTVFEKTERIIQHVRRITEKVGRLDSKAVSIPVGDLKQFSSVQDHHVARHGFDCALFTPDARPHCVRFRYSLCEVTPVGSLRGVDPYRKDGLHSSEIFKLWPVVLKEHQTKSPDLSLYRKRGRTMTFSKKYKRLKPRSRTLPNADSVALFHQSRSEDSVSTASGDCTLSRSQPSILVAVDTSGTGFHKMASFRQSLRGTASLDRKSRRRTVSGVPDGIMQEIEAFERGKKTARNMPRNYSFDDLDSRTELERGDAVTQYLDELDAKMEERAEEEHASRDAKLLKFLPCRRSRSLPRCLKLKEGRGHGGLTFEEDTCKDKPMSTATHGYASSSLSIGSAGGFSSSSRAARRSSIISSKLKSFVTSTLRPRPKSLDFDTVDILGNDDADNEEDNSAESRAKTLGRALSPSMPDNISSLASSRESQVGPGTYYYFASSTLPRSQARKYDFPWESLPKDWTTSVRLREISRRRKEERNSSSGNWSGSSNRQSLDSEPSFALPSTSTTSLGRDSGRDSFLDDREDSRGEKSRAEPGVSSFLPASPTTDTEQWLASLAQRAAAREDAAAAGADVTQSLTRLSELTRQNIQALEETFSPAKQQLLRLDDEVSSVYSLDQDGFYTSFHTDSGLRRSTGTLIDDDDDDDDDDGELSTSKENQSFLSTESGNTTETVIFCPMGNVTPGMANGSRGGKVRPKPPVRSGSRLSSRDTLVGSEDKRQTVDNVQNKNTANPASPTDSEALGESSPYDSDQETIYARLKAKTKISPRSIPSWCSFSDDDSPESSSICLSHANPHGTAPVSFSGNMPGKEISPGSDRGCKDLAEDSWDFDSLPQRYLESKVWEEDLSDQSNSWPRSRRTQQSPAAGILKREKSPAGSLKPKTLNFAPVVSMFDPLSPQGVEVPLNAASCTSSSSSSSDTSTAGLAFTLSHAPPVTHSRLSRSLGDVKHCPPAITPGESAGRTPCRGHRPPSLQITSTPVSQVYHQSRVKGGADMSSESSVCSSESSLLSGSEGGQSEGYRDLSSQSTLSSSSSAGLSDIDSSLTYVTMSGSNSTLVLDSDDLPAAVTDDLPTPVNSPVAERDGCFSDFPRGPAEDESLLPESVPAFQKSPSNPHQSSSPAFPVDPPHAVSARQSLGSFAADANTEAAPVLWREQSNVMMSSADSGFSSSSSSAVCVIQHGPSNHHKDHYHHRHHQHPHTLAQHVNSISPQNVYEGRVDCGAGPDSGNNNNNNNNVTDGRDSRRGRVRTGNWPVKQCAEHKREPHRTPHSEGPQLPAPRTDSYRAATRDFNPLSHCSRDSAHGSAAAKQRSHSSKPHRHPHKSTAYPTAMTADADGVTRADSYRLAVRNTQGVVGEIATRNVSYRMATEDDDPAGDARMDAINAWDKRQSVGNRDVRRMGITDIDQLKSYDSDSSASRGSTSSRSGKSPSRGFASIRASHKKMTPEVENLLRGDKTPSPEVRRISSVSSGGSKDKEKTKRRSSTYFRFDSIFEQGDGMYSSTDTLRAESVEMINSEDGLLMTDKVVGRLPPGRVRSSGGRRSMDDKPATSILGSIKTTIKSISGKNADKDTWKYDGYN